MGRTDADLHAEAQAAVKLAEEQEMLRRGQGLTSVEVPSRTPSGETRWLVDTRVPVRDRSGAIIGIGGCWRDITERRLAEDDVKVNLALQRVRNEVLRMQGEDDWMAVVKVFDDELRQVVAVHG
jgi:hypothetical protein